MFDITEASAILCVGKLYGIGTLDV